MLFLLRYKVQK